MPIRYVSQLSSGDIAIYGGKPYNVEFTEDRIVLTGVGPDGETEIYTFSHNSQILVDSPNESEARERAEMYWTGYLTALSEKSPNIGVIEARVEESWQKFYGPLSKVRAALR